MYHDASNIRLDDSAPCWCLSKGMAGMISQMTGLAEAVGLAHICKSTRLASPWRWMPMGLIPRRASSIAEPALLDSPIPPRLVISCGRHGVVPALALKKQYGDQLLAIHIQDPKTDPTAFDLVVVPRHDRLRGANVVVTTGAIHHINAERLAETRANSPFDEFMTNDQPVVTVLVGGPNGCYSFSDADVHRFLSSLRRLALESRARLIVLPSNRTPQGLARQLHEEFSGQHYVWDGTSPNPYLAALAAASHLVVTGDSVSMITEAAATGRPVFVNHLTERRRAQRFRDFHNLFQREGITRPFDGSLAEWTYTTPNDTPRVAAIIRERIAKNETSARTSQHNSAA